MTDTATKATLFERSGYATLSDMRAPEYRRLFDELEAVQRQFLERAPDFRDPAYKWDTDTLHGWSRCWEYPFVYHHVLRERARRHGRLALADFGSGSTFFSIAVARLGVDLFAFDNDPVCVGDLRKAAVALGIGAGTLRPELSGATLPAPDASVDVAYSISVLEHMPDPVPIAAELARIVRPGGLLLVTLDIDVEGAAGVTPEHFDRVRDELARAFTFEYPERTVHHFDVLSSKNSPWPRAGEQHLRGLMWRTKDRRLLPLIGGPSPGVLSVYGAVLRRKA
ncbi:MAG: class I SAM-dependent methyltransferase [Vulcanimicrobiaceae bacterium]